MIDTNVNKLLYSPPKPKERHANQEKITQPCGRKFFCKSKTHDRNKDKKINQPLVEDIHDGLIDRRDFLKFFSPVEHTAKPQVKNCKGKAIHTAKDDKCMICHLFTELEEMSKFKKGTTSQVDLCRIDGVLIALGPDQHSECTNIASPLHIPGLVPDHD